MTTSSIWRKATRRLGADSVPLNFLHPIAGTPLGEVRAHSLLKNVSRRRACSACSIRAARCAPPAAASSTWAHRQGEIFNAVNSIFVNGYLTTAGWDYERTRELILRSGFEVETPVGGDR